MQSELRFAKNLLCLNESSKMLKKILISFAFVVFSTAAFAEFHSKYDFAMTLDSKTKVTYAKVMIRNHQNWIDQMSPLIDKYDHKWSHHAWFAKIKRQRQFYLNEIVKYEQLIPSDTPEVVLVNTEVKVDQNKKRFQRGDPIVTVSTSEIEETVGNIVKVYEVITTTTKTPYTVHTAQVTQTIKHYSDGTRTTTLKSEAIGMEKEFEISEDITRNLVREYEINETVDDLQLSLGTITPNTLTVQDYESRSDVNYYQTQTYVDAFHVLNPYTSVDHILSDEGKAKNGLNLLAIKAPHAWAKGWTGKDSIIAILDTGINENHSEFKDKILDSKCFTPQCRWGENTIDDKNSISHGTHVASIAAARLDGKGMTGVAPDAKLLIGKVATDSGYYHFTTLDDGIRWAAENGADVINSSGNYGIDYQYYFSLKEIEPGVYYSNDKRTSFQTNGYANFADIPTYDNLIESMKGHDAVLVMAAGNQDFKVPGIQSLIALNKEINDRVIIAGNIDLKRNFESYTTNNAGTICLELNEQGTCASEQRISDRYLLAPGTDIIGADKNGNYRPNSGTSMSAPTISGAVAILRQMWPHMYGGNIAQILLDTANKDAVANYDVHVHGQGLLDLDAATQPQGEIKIATSSNINDNQPLLSDSGLVSLDTQISALEEVMIVDEYNRDFYTSLDTSRNQEVRPLSLARTLLTNEVPDYYLSYTEGQTISFDQTKIAINDTGNFGVSHLFDNGIQIGFSKENNKFLGNIANSHLMKVNGANTTYVGYQFKNDTFFGGAQLGATSLDVDKTSFLKSASTAYSFNATLGAKTKISKGELSIMAGLPVTVSSADLQFQMPTSVASDGSISTSNKTSSWKSSIAKLDLSMSYKTSIADNISFNVHAGVYGANQANSQYNSNVGLNFEILF